MTYNEFLKKVIDQGIEAVKLDYYKPKDKDKLKGALAGFEACRDLEALDLWDLLDSAKIATIDARNIESNRYWWFACYELEVEWVCNVVSAARLATGLPIIVNPTARGVFMASRILGTER